MDTSRFKLMQVMLSSQEGGAETFFEKLALALADAGIRQYVVVEPNPRREELLSAHPLVDVKVIRFRGLSEILGRIRIELYARRVEPSAMLAWMGRATKRAPRDCCPVIARAGGYYKMEPRYFDCDLVIGNTPDLMDHFIKQGIPAEKVEFIPNFGDIRQTVLSRDKARESIRISERIPNTHRIILALGRLHPVKGLDVLLRAIAPVPDVTVLLAGDGPLRADLEALAKELGVADRIRFLGWRSDVAELFAATDICCFTSRREGLGNVILEAWGQKVPIVAARAEGPSWLIDDDVDGLLFDIDDHRQLTKCIQTLLDQPELGKRLADAGNKKLLQRFGRDVIVKQYIDMFDRVTVSGCYSDS